MKDLHDSELMALADGELDERTTREIEELLASDPAARTKVEAVGELGELVRGHLELAADDVPDQRFAALWREVDKAIERERAPEPSRDGESVPVRVPVEGGFWRRLGRWFDDYRGHMITGAVSAGAVAALTLILRPGTDGDGSLAGGSGRTDPRAPIPAQPVVHRPAEIEALDTPGGTGMVFNLEDEDGSTTVIWVTPEDTVEGI
jgi:anti-sigma factor RsiW